MPRSSCFFETPYKPVPMSEIKMTFPSTSTYNTSPIESSFSNSTLDIPTPILPANSDTTSTSTTTTPSSSTTAPLTTFHLFPKLYPELRLKIYQMALSHPRIVTIHFHPPTASFRSPTPVPALLHTTRESRHEAQRLYPLRFGTRSSPSHIPFSTQLDTLYFPRRGTMGYDDSLRDFGVLVQHPDDLRGVRVVALDSVDTREKRPWESYDKAVFIKSFPRLEAVVLVAGPRRSWLSNIPRPLGVAAAKDRGEVEFVALGEEGEVVRRGFEAAFWMEEEALRGIRWGEYVAPRLPPVVVVRRRSVV